MPSPNATEVSIEGSSKTPYAWASVPAVSFTSLPMSAPGFFDALATAGIKILATIADREERGEIYAAVRADIRAGGDAKILNLLAARNQEIQRALREMFAGGRYARARRWRRTFCRLGSGGGYSSRKGITFCGVAVNRAKWPQLP